MTIAVGAFPAISNLPQSIEMLRTCNISPSRHSIDINNDRDTLGPWFICNIRNNRRSKRIDNNNRQVGIRRGHRRIDEYVCLNPCIGRLKARLESPGNHSCCTADSNRGGIIQSVYQSRHRPIGCITNKGAGGRAAHRQAERIDMAAAFHIHIGLCGHLFKRPLEVIGSGRWVGEITNLIIITTIRNI